VNIQRRQYLQHVQVYLDQRQGSLSWWSPCRSCYGECLSRQTVSSWSIPLSLRLLMCHHHSYRFRLVSISCDPSFVFSIDDHQMTVIEVEGTNVQPLVIDQLEIFVGVCQCGSKHVIYSVNQLQNRSTLLSCRKMLLFIYAHDGVPHVRTRSLRTGQLLTTVCVLSILSGPNNNNVNRDPCSPKVSDFGG
jgi:hypothetical protein